MRGLAPGLPTPFPLADTLPGMLADDGFVRRWCAGLDEVLAPVVSSLDCLPAYLDPGTAPLDVLSALAGWVGLVLDEDAPPERRRELVARAADLHRRRGTSDGVRDAVAAWFGVVPEVVESGAADWSADPGAPLPGDREPFLLVRLRLPDADAVDRQHLETLVASTKPAHVPHRVELLAEPAPGS